MREQMMGWRPLLRFLAALCTIITALVAAEVWLVGGMRARTLAGAQHHLQSLSIALAEQANRTLQAVDLVFERVSDQLEAAAEADPMALTRGLSGADQHVRLAEQITGMPFLRAIRIFDAEGWLVNASDHWPPTVMALGNHPSFTDLRADPSVSWHIGPPEPSVTPDDRLFRISRRLNAADGTFAGIVVASISLRFFDDLYRATAGDDLALSLVRSDGLVMTRFPADAREGTADAPSEAAAGWVVAAAPLADYPLRVRASRPETAALRDWTGPAWVIGLVSLGCLGWIAVAGVTLVRWWSNQAALDHARADQAEAERARAVAEAELARERERHALEASQAKSSFLAMMSHEIRTPMNGVLGLAGTLLDGELSDDQRRVVEAIRDSGDSLLRILNDILDLSKLDAGRMTFEDMAFSPTTLTHGIVSILGPRGRAKGLLITASCDHTLPPAVVGDAGRIRQVLLNLVSNAIKFTDSGSVSLECRRLAASGGRATVQWVVRDTGIGIPPDRIGALFGDFVQADATIARRFGGTGMGLAISRRLIERMGGVIAVESRVGDGTVFRVELTLPLGTLPVAAEEAQTDVVGAFHAYLGALGRPLRLLFAEDNPTNQFVALQMLRAFNVQMDVVGDGLEAVEAAQTFLYDVICMDMRMPEMDGLEATRLIRRQGGRLAELPIVALTANAFPEDVQACLDAGMNLFVAKPVQKETLLHAILTALGAVTSLAATLAPEGPPPDAPRVTADGHHSAPLDPSVLAELEDAIGVSGIGEMVTLFRSETTARLARLSEPGRDEALDLREVHTLKGAASTVGAAALGRLAKEIEARLRAGGDLLDEDIAALRSRFLAWDAAIGAIVPSDPAPSTN